MNKRKIYVCFTMDCESPDSPFGGPENWYVAEMSINGFTENLLKYKQKVTFFVTPASVIQKPKLFFKISKIFEVGMHLHPFDPITKKRLYIGQFDKEEQRKILKENKENWSYAIGMEPKSFRPGNASANDHTFPVLVELGFSQGSCSIPYRKIPELFADWEGALLDPHHVSPFSRLEKGNLDFLEVPISVDPVRKKINGSPFELRIEHGDITYHSIILKNIIERFKREEIPVKSIVFLTHSSYDYTSPNSKTCRTLIDLILYLQDLIIKENFIPVPITIEELHITVDKENLKNF